MSDCSNTPITPRRKVAVVAASTMSIAATAPILLRHSGQTDWTYLLLGLAVGVSVGIAALLLVKALRSTTVRR